MKHLLSTVVTLVILLSAPAFAAPKMQVVLPKKTKNACIRTAARLASALKYEAALEQLATRKCTEELAPQEQEWVSLMEGVLYHGLEQDPQAREAFCRVLQGSPAAKLPIARPAQPLREYFEGLRLECQESSTPEPAQAEAPQPAEPVTAPAVAEATPPAAGMSPPPAVEPAPTAPPSGLGEPAPASSLLDSFELHAGLHLDVEPNMREFLQLAGLGLQGSLHLGHGLRAGVGLTALGSANFLPQPAFLFLADARLAYTIIPPREGFGLQVYATGGPLLYTLHPASLGARTGLGLAMDMSRVRVSLGAAYEWRSHYRLDSRAVMVGLGVGWKLLGDSP